VRRLDTNDPCAKECLSEFDSALHAILGAHESLPDAVHDPDDQDIGQYFDAKENDLLSDGLIGAELIFPRGGDSHEIARVSECVNVMLMVT
jgi:hypothetical protein